MIRRKDFNGAHECIGAEELMSSLIVWRLSARKTSTSCKFVISRVLDGGVGAMRGGSLERSMLDGLDRCTLESGLEDGGEVSENIFII